MFIEFEETPNPQTLKFLPHRKVLERGTRTFTNAEAADGSPLAERLFGIEGVTGVFLAVDFVSVTKAAAQSWDDLKPLVLTALMDHFAAGLPAVLEERETGDAALSDAIENQIIELIETRVKPAVARDGGNIEFAGFSDGVVYLRMEGACAGCPSASMTLKHGVENMLRHFVPEVTRVEQVDCL